MRQCEKCGEMILESGEYTTQYLCACHLLNWYTPKTVEKVNKQPFLCPVCQGKGVVPNGFYLLNENTTQITPETCKACNGTGIVWG